MPRPSLLELQRQVEEDGGCEATDGCFVEPDGSCEHQQPSLLLGPRPHLTPAQPAEQP
jgi:hypothetical protein